MTKSFSDANSTATTQKVFFTESRFPKVKLSLPPSAANGVNGTITKKTRRPMHNIHPNDVHSSTEIQDNPNSSPTESHQSSPTWHDGHDEETISFQQVNIHL